MGKDIRMDDPWLPFKVSTIENREVIMNKIFLLLSLAVSVPALKAGETTPVSEKSTKELAQEYRAYAAHLNKIVLTTSVSYLTVCFVGAMAKKVPFLGSMPKLRTAINIVEWPLGFGNIGCVIARDTVENSAKKLEKQAADDKKAN